jgi:hypothetical protein
MDDGSAHILVHVNHVETPTRGETSSVNGVHQSRYKHRVGPQGRRQNIKR